MQKKFSISMDNEMRKNIDLIATLNFVSSGVVVKTAIDQLVSQGKENWETLIKDYSKRSKLDKLQRKKKDDIMRLNLLLEDLNSDIAKIEQIKKSKEKKIIKGGL